MENEKKLNNVIIEEDQVVTVEEEMDITAEEGDDAVVIACVVKASQQ